MNRLPGLLRRRSISWGEFVRRTLLPQRLLVRLRAWLSMLSSASRRRSARRSSRSERLAATRTGRARRAGVRRAGVARGARSSARALAEDRPRAADGRDGSRLHLRARTSRSTPFFPGSVRRRRRHLLMAHAIARKRAGAVKPGSAHSQTRRPDVARSMTLSGETKLSVRTFG